MSVRLWHIPAWSCGHTFSKHIVQKLSCAKGVAGQTLKQILTLPPHLVYFTVKTTLQRVAVKLQWKYSESTVLWFGLQWFTVIHNAVLHCTGLQVKSCNYCRGSNMIHFTVEWLQILWLILASVKEHWNTVIFKTI